VGYDATAGLLFFSCTPCRGFAPGKRTLSPFSEPTRPPGRELTFLVVQEQRFLLCGLVRSPGLLDAEVFFFLPLLFFFWRPGFFPRLRWDYFFVFKRDASFEASVLLCRRSLAGFSSHPARAHDSSSSGFAPWTPVQALPYRPESGLRKTLHGLIEIVRSFPFFFSAVSLVCRSRPPFVER